MTVSFQRDFNPLKPRRGAAWTCVSLADALQKIGGGDALVAWDRDVTLAPVLNRTWATVCDSGGRVWLSKIARRPVPIDLHGVWDYSRPTDTAPIGSWSSTAYLNMLFDQVVFDIGVPTRARTPFKDNGILFVGELVKRSSAELLAMYNLGKVSFHGIQQALAKHGLELSMDVGAWAPPPSLTLTEPPPGSYDITLDCEVFDYVRTCDWRPLQYRLIRPPDGRGYAVAYRDRNYESNWLDHDSWESLLRILRLRRLRLVGVATSQASQGTRGV